jgi:hypothetical protein
MHDFPLDVFHYTFGATAESLLQRTYLRWAFQCVSAGTGPLSSFIEPRRTQRDSLHFSCVRHQGGGFSGFWFHLGYLHSVHPNDLHSFDYYCFSAGCLSTYLYTWILISNSCTFNVSDSSVINSSAYSQVSCQSS